MIIDMRSHKEKLEILEQTSLPRILVYLLKGSVSQTDLNKDISASQGAIYKALDILEQHGFIIITPPSGVRRRKDVALTDKGKRLAEALQQFEELL